MKKTYTTEERITALADYLDINKDEITVSEWNDKYFEISDGSEYLVLSDEEADEETRSEIEESLWAFDASFICMSCGFLAGKSYNAQNRIIASLEAMQKVSESANQFIRAMIDGTCGLDEFVKKAIEADGRGHFLADYDGEENKQGDCYIYRIN